MQLIWLDWLVIALYFLLNIGIGLYYYRKASGSVGDWPCSAPKCEVSTPVNWAAVARVPTRTLDSLAALVSICWTATFSFRCAAAAI